MQKNLSILCCLTTLTFSTFPAYAQQSVEACVMQQFASGNANLTLADIRKLCGDQTYVEGNVEGASEGNSEGNSEEEVNIVTKSNTSTGAISNRRTQERQTEFEPYVITPHKMNYVLPALTTTAINKGAYSDFNGYEDNLANVEAKLQLSLKVPLNPNSMFIEGDGLYFGFTIQAWWQIYADNISKPFRETNYQPELFYYAPLDWQPLGGNTSIVLGVEHQSNGQAQNLSRSWNRIYTNFLYEKDNFALSFRPWVRITEDEKIDQFDPKGDDNPDIDDYLGHFQLGMVYQWKDFEFSARGRQNFATHKGSAEFGLTFPLWGKLRGYATTFTGYGESLIDYNYNQTRFGLGIALNNVL
ncbi:MAG: phospholipase A1 [Phenylobacterium sp.]|jgi:phospholipase A1